MSRRLQEKNLVGYRSRLTATAGETVDFMVHSDRGEAFEADLVRIIHGEANATRGPGLVVGGLLLRCGRFGATTVGSAESCNRVPFGGRGVSQNM